MEQDSIRLDQALAKRGLVGSRQEAIECIEKGLVTVNGSVVTKTHKTVAKEDILVVLQGRKYVSRGGEKLEGVLKDVYGSDEKIRERLQGTYALDVGSSTGGFTDCLLSYGASQVDAVDVGTSQLHETLKKDIRVHSFEMTDIRSFVSDRKYEVIVADLSFVSLGVVLPTIMSFAKLGTSLFLLVKPQFEVGREFLKKGIVRDEDKQREAVEMLLEEVKAYDVKEVLSFPCVIQGGDGNQEYFLYVEM